ncbi:Helix-hairpin-helix motif protein [uncultured archaeon]|nr:Helix-hairpin-helix motif protein [uncultured archaeon]
MIKAGAILLFIFLISNISAICSETQIDINSASAEELDKLVGIGTAKAQAIILARPFSSLDDLINVKGIGEVTLTNIKTQGLACVNSENKIATDNVTENVNYEITNNFSINNEVKIETISAPENLTSSEEKPQETASLNPISLDAQNIKSENNKETLKRNLSFYGIIAICVIFGALFLYKNRKRKNEFN